MLDSNQERGFFDYCERTEEPIGTSDRLKESCEISLSKLFERL